MAKDNAGMGADKEAPNQDFGSTDAGTADRKNRRRRASGQDEDSFKPKPAAKKFTNYSNFVGKANASWWYTALEKLVSLLTAIPFYLVIGKKINPADRSKFNYYARVPKNTGDEKAAFTSFIDASNKTTTSTPGFMTFDIMPLPGVSIEDGSDGLNLAMQKLWINIRKRIATTMPYQPADIGMFLTALDSIYSLHAYCVTRIGLLNQVDSMNRFIGKDLYNAYAAQSSENAIKGIMNNVEVDPYNYRNDLQEQTNLYNYLNKLAYKGNKLFFPKLFPITDRHMWLFSNIFVDRDSDTAQLYVPKLDGYWMIDETGTEGTRLVYKQRPSRFWDVLKDLGQMIDSIYFSDSFVRIMGDMMRALGDNTELWEMGHVDKDFIMDFTVSDEFMQTIHNSNVIPRDLLTDESKVINQDVMTNQIVYRPALNVTRYIRKLFKATPASSTDTGITWLTSNIHVDPTTFDKLHSLDEVQYGTVLLSALTDKFVYFNTTVAEPDNEQILIMSRMKTPINTSFDFTQSSGEVTDVSVLARVHPVSDMIVGSTIWVNEFVSGPVSSTTLARLVGIVAPDFGILNMGGQFGSVVYNTSAAPGVAYRHMGIATENMLKEAFKAAWSAFNWSPELRVLQGDIVTEGLWSNLHGAPLISRRSLIEDAVNYCNLVSCWELDNIGYISNQLMNNINNVVNLSLWFME